MTAGQSGLAPCGRSRFIEAFAATAAVLAITRLLYAFRWEPFMAPRISYIVAYLLMGTPILVLWIRRIQLDFFSLGGRDLAVAVKWFAIASLVIFPPFLLAAHGWQILVAGRAEFAAAGYPRFFSFALSQLLLVALPEEFFFRGYFQSAMGCVFSGRRRILGVNVGWGFVVTAAVFAVAHTIVTYQWWHFSIFFPALVFGWLRERTGNIVAPTLFHAAANLLMDWFTRSYV